MSLNRFLLVECDRVPGIRALDWFYMYYFQRVQSKMRLRYVHIMESFIASSVQQTQSILAHMEWPLSEMADKWMQNHAEPLRLYWSPNLGRNLLLPAEFRFAASQKVQSYIINWMNNSHWKKKTYLHKMNCKDFKWANFRFFCERSFEFVQMISKKRFSSVVDAIFFLESKKREFLSISLVLFCFFSFEK